MCLGGIEMEHWLNPLSANPTKWLKIEFNYRVEIIIFGTTLDSCISDNWAKAY